MSLKRTLLESCVRVASFTAPARKDAPADPGSIFVLRNNDIGDLLVITPLFEALKRRFPQAKIVAGVGSWNLPTLENNPHVDEVLPVNAPWHNLSCCRFRHNSPRGLMDSARYICTSPEMEAIRLRRFDIGIDVLGSPEGSFLLMNAGIPHRIGVKGYAGGHSAAQQTLVANFDEHVGHFALRFASILGAQELPANRPQIFLTPAESEYGKTFWQKACPNGCRRIVIGPGGGFAGKCWPLDHYLELAKLLAKQGGCRIAVVGGTQDQEAGVQLAAMDSSIHNMTLQPNLRSTFSIVEQADLVICNSSMLMHAAAAFCKPTVVLLSDWFASASLHSSQWGYGDLTHVWGMEEGTRSTICSPSEVMEKLREIGA